MRASHIKAIRVRREKAPLRTQEGALVLGSVCAGVIVDLVGGLYIIADMPGSDEAVAEAVRLAALCEAPGG